MTSGPAETGWIFGKPTIDDLEPLLGAGKADRRWNPQDGHIARLGLHLNVDQEFGHDVGATIWARAADPD